jgi:GntR family transcriptional regulator
MSVADFLRPDQWLNPAAGPLYVQLRRRIETGIESGFLAPDTPLPPEREIAALTDLSRVTVRKAIGNLVAQGAVVQKQGSGSYIAPRHGRVQQSLSRLTSFSEDMARRGLQSESRWLERGLFLPTPEEVMALGLAAQDRVARLERVRYADGRPMAIERASLSIAILPDPASVESSLYASLSARGLRPVRAVQRISAANLGKRDAELLDVPTGAAGLRIERISFLSNGAVVEFTRSIYRGDAYDFAAELQIEPDIKGGPA